MFVTNIVRIQRFVSVGLFSVRWQFLVEPEKKNDKSINKNNLSDVRSIIRIKVSKRIGSIK